VCGNSWEWGGRRGEQASEREGQLRELFRERGGGRGGQGVTCTLEDWGGGGADSYVRYVCTRAETSAHVHHDLRGLQEKAVR
jgi:hypothetical protein